MSNKQEMLTKFSELANKLSEAAMLMEEIYGERGEDLEGQRDAFLDAQNVLEVTMEKVETVQMELEYEVDDAPNSEED